MQSTKQQLDVIYHRTGNALVRAVAGSGKTSILVEHIISLFEEGMSHLEIFVIVFNDSASKDFTAKLRSKNVEKLPQVRTFHAIGKRIYDSLVSNGLLPYYELNNSEYKANRLAIKSLIKIHQRIKKDEYPDKDEIESFISFIELVKSDLKIPEHIFEEYKFPSDRSYYISAYYLFESERKALGFRTFSDLIHTPVNFFIEHPKVLEKYNKYIQLLLLDEVQDINEISFMLMKQITSSKTRWLLVGDEDQCIYEWRGAKPEYITHKFKDELFPLKEFKMTRTFRYGHELSLAINNLITCNVNRTNKICISGKEEQTKIFINQYKDTMDIGTEVCNVIANKKPITNLSDFAILIRLYSHSIPIELSLLEQNIPYFIKDRGSLFKVKEIVAFTTYLELISGKLLREDNETILQKLNTLIGTPYIGLKLNLNTEDVILFKENPMYLSEFILSYDTPKLSAFKRTKLQQIAYCVRYAITKKDLTSASNAIKFYIHTTDLLKTYNIFLTKQEDIDNKVYLINSFIMYLEKRDNTPSKVIELFTHLENTQARYSKKKEDAIIISSIHKAKGLQWKNVIIPTLEERKFPYYCEKRRYNIESERRLFYVATTRAQDNLFLLSPLDDEFLHHIKNNKVILPVKPFTSRFLYELKITDAIHNARSIHNNEKINTNNPIVKRYMSEINVRNLTTEDSVTYDTSKINQKYPFTTPFTAQEINKGMEIYHLIFKIGKVINSKNSVITVLFDKFGVKTLNLKNELIFPSFYSH
jgi:DNA helicase-2/ATP-dependent DNA helicase PcrA